MSEAPTLSAEVIEGWLGVGPGGALTCRFERWHERLVWVMAAFTALMLPYSKVPLYTLLQFLLFATLAVLFRRRALIVVAEAQGLSVRQRGQREYYAWDELEAVRQGTGEYVLTTRRGPVRLASGGGSDRLVRTVTRLLALRAAGAVLPSATPVPTQALSRLGATEAADERGLSQVRQ